jgi:hypothetical protein
MMLVRGSSERYCTLGQSWYSVNLEVLPIEHFAEHHDFDGISRCAMAPGRNRWSQH